MLRQEDRRDRTVLRSHTAGARLRDIGAAIVRHVGSAGSIVEAYGGHGIGWSTLLIGANGPEIATLAE